jgi:hypothetical protein
LVSGWRVVKQSCESPHRPGSSFEQAGDLQDMRALILGKIIGKREIPFADALHRRSIIARHGVDDSEFVDVLLCHRINSGQQERVQRLDDADSQRLDGGADIARHKV